MLLIGNSVEFIWDKGNREKNWIKHKVTNKECEEVFFDESKVIGKDRFHSEKEERFILLGETKRNRLLFVVFTLRGKKVRVISGRDVNKKERKLHEKAT
ncbi:MAG: BrnT family toxin [Candidatus Shapirobacteria bacterium]